MSETEHVVKVKVVGDSKDAEQTLKKFAREQNKLNNESKKTLTAGVKMQDQQRKTRKKMAQEAGPTTEKKITDELKRQNKEIAQQNRLIRDRIRLMQSQNRVKDMDYKKRSQTTVRGGFMSQVAPERRDGRNWRGMLGQTLGKGAIAGASMLAGGLTALLTMPFQAIASEYQASNTYRRSMAGLGGLNKGAPFGAGVTSGGVDQITRKMAEYGYDPNETLQATRSFSRATGDYRDTAPGMVLSRQLGMDPTELASMFSEMRKGRGGFGAEGRSDMQRILAAAVKSGVNASTLPEYLEGVKSFITGAGGVSGGAVTGEPMAQLLALFNKSGIAGLQGARGAAIGEKFDQAIKTPGGGEEGRAFILNTLGFGKSQGGASFYNAQKQMELGLSGSGGSSLVKQLIDNADRINGSQQESNLYLDKVTGISLDYLEKIRDAFGKGSQSDVDKLLQESTATELTHLASLDENMKQLVGKAKLSAEIELDNIDLGDQFASSLEEMQKLLRDFLKDTGPAVLDVLNLVKDTLVTIDTDIRAVGDFLRNIIGEVAGTNDLAAENQASADMTAAFAEAQNVLQSGNTGYHQLSDDDMYTLFSAITPLLEDLQRTDARLQSPELAARVALGDTLEQGGLRSDQAIDLVRLNATLEALNRNLTNPVVPFADAAGNVNRIDTTREMLAVLTAYGLSLPAGARAVIDRSGGAP